MKSTIFIVVLIFCGCLSTCLAASAFGAATVHESHPNQCYHKDTQTYYKPGSTWQLEGCGQASCMMLNLTGNPQLMVSYESCGSMDVASPCYLVEDLAMAYPDCCPQPICPENEPMEDDSAARDDSDFSRQVTDYAVKGPFYDNVLYQDQDQEQINPEKFQSLDFNEKSVRQFSPKFQYIDSGNEYNDYRDYNYQWF